MTLEGCPDVPLVWDVWNPFTIIKKCSPKSVVFFLFSVLVSPYKQGKRVKQKDPLNPYGFKGSNIVIIQPLDVVPSVVREDICVVREDIVHRCSGLTSGSRQKCCPKSVVLIDLTHQLLHLRDCLG